MRAVAQIRHDCPGWCTEGDCQGEHNTQVGDYVGATGGLPHASKYGMGQTWFPGVGVAVSWDTLDDLAPAVTLTLSGENYDSQADLRLDEAFELLASLAQAVTYLATGLEGARLARVQEMGAEHVADLTAELSRRLDRVLYHRRVTS